jgi:hypothetical protein
MKPSLPALASALLFLPLHAGQLLNAVPSDAAAVFAVHDLPALEVRRQETPLRHLPQLNAFETEIEALKTVHNILERFHEQLSGELVFTVGNPAPYFALVQEHQARRSTLWDDFTFSEEDDTGMDAILAAQEEMDMAELQALHATLSLKAAIRDAEAVETLFAEIRETLPNLNWTLHDNILIVSFSESAIAAARARLEAPGEATLTDSADYRQALEVLGESDTLFYLNIPALVQAFSNVLNNMPGAVPGFDARKITDWLKPESILPAAFASRLEPDALLINSHYGFREETELSRLLLGTNTEAAPAPAFIHRSAGQVVTTRWEPARTLLTLQQELTGIAPELGVGFGFLLMTANMNLGFDLNTQFLQTFGTGLSFAAETDYGVANQIAQMENLEDPAALLALTQEHPTGGVHYLAAFELKDAETFRTSLATLVSRVTNAPMPEAVTEDGVEKTYLFRNLTALPGELRHRIAATFLDGHFLLAVGDPSMLTRANAALGDESLRLWNQPDFKESRAALPADAQMFSYASKQELHHSLGQIRTAFNWLSAISGDTVRFTGDLPEEPVFQNSIGISLREGHRLNNRTRMPFTTEE